MKLIKPKYEFIEQEAGENGIYKMIELAGRTCYKSEDKITEDSAKGFVERMVKSGHGAMLEHGTVYLYFTLDFDNPDKELQEVFHRYRDNKYSRFTFDEDPENTGIYITTNYRVLAENGWLDDLKYRTEPIFPYHKRRVTVRFTMDRIGSQSFCRHRVFSFAQESTRYCNYSKDKFNNEIKFIIPCWCNIPEGEYTWWDGDWCSVKDLKILKHDDSGESDEMLHLFSDAEFAYKTLINKGWTAQKARTVLPVGLATEIVTTGFVSDWEHFFELRDDAHAHPQAQELAKPLHEDFIKKGYIKDEHLVA